VGGGRGWYVFRAAGFEFIALMAMG